MEAQRKIRELLQLPRMDSSVYKPYIFDLSKAEDAEVAAGLLQEGLMAIHDELHGQLEELVKLRRPRQQFFEENETEDLITDHLGGLKESEYGLWVYYPWSARMVHLLPEKEFIEVRTNRNRNKITLGESSVLSDKKVGVIGLSVGQSVSVTMAMERSFGEIRLADFDILELSNLNRIRTGIHNLGIPKVISVAREIYEIDPFLNVKIYPEGISEQNIDNFLTEGGKLDALIDECDGLDIKILCRLRAKDLRIPVLMEASDRGTIDVERFDLEEDRPILHGFVDHLDISKVKDLKTNEEKVPYLLPIAGMETLSQRMRASMLEIGQSLTTWPQLSSAVTLGGGITADTYRRMMLNEFTQSGRYFIDLDELMPENKEEVEEEEVPGRDLQPLTEDMMKDMLKDVHLNGSERLPIGLETAESLVSAAITAPSAGNNQPWKWLFDGEAIYLFHDRVRSVSFSDYGDMASMISLGACLENIHLKALELGFRANIDLLPRGENDVLIARITLAGAQEDVDVLSSFIGSRHTNRTKSLAGSISADELKLLQKSIADPNAQFMATTSQSEIFELSEIVSACERIRIMHPMGHADFYEQEVRWSDTESREKGDGIDIATVELTPSELAGMKLASDPSVVECLRKWNGGKGFEKLSREAVVQSNAVGLIRVKGSGKKDLLQGGRSLQRLWLKATELDIAIHPISAGLFMFARLFDGKGELLSNGEKDELNTLHERYRRIFPEESSWHDLFMFRMFKSEKEPVRSYRLPLDQVFIKA